MWKLYNQKWNPVGKLKFFDFENSHQFHDHWGQPDMRIVAYNDSWSHNKFNRRRSKRRENPTIAVSRLNLLEKRATCEDKMWWQYETALDQIQLTGSVARETMQRIDIDNQGGPTLLVKWYDTMTHYHEDMKLCQTMPNNKCDGIPWQLTWHSRSRVFSRNPKGEKQMRDVQGRVGVEFKGMLWCLSTSSKVYYPKLIMFCSTDDTEYAARDVF